MWRRQDGYVYVVVRGDFEVLGGLLCGYGGRKELSEEWRG
jgi:hypothetical protein